MKILMVTLGFYPAVTWGGPVKIVYQMSRELVARGHDVTIFCTNLLNKREKIQPGTFERWVDGIRVVYFQTWNLRWWRGTLGPAWSIDMARYVKKHLSEFDLVHIHGARNPILLPVIQKARRAGIPFIIQPHGVLPVIINSLVIKRIYDVIFGRLELNGLSALVALHESERQQAIDRHVPVDKIEVIPNGISLADGQPLPSPGSFRDVYSLTMDEPLILFLARINKKKGTDMLVEAFHLLEHQGAKLVIAGPDDGQLPEVKALIRHYQLEKRVILTGVLDEEQVTAAFLDADLFVLPCRRDTYPTTILEACVAGKPMVITEGCESAYLVNGRIADVVPFDAGLFAQAMDRLLSDHAHYQKYKRNCRLMLEDTFALSKSVDRLEGLYKQVLLK